MKSLSALNHYFWKYKKYLIWGIITVIASNLFTIYPAQIIRTALDSVAAQLKVYDEAPNLLIKAQIREQIQWALLKYAGLMILISAISGVFLFFTRQTLIYMSRLIEYDLRNDIYNHFQTLSLGFFRRNKTGDIMSRMTEDVNKVRMYLGPAVMYTLNTIVRFVMVISAMLAINVKLTIFALLPLPILSYMIYKVQSIIEIRSRVIQEQLSKLTTFTQEIFSGIRVVKAYVKEEQIQSRFSSEVEVYKERSMHSAQVDALFFPAVTFLIGLSGVLTVWIGSEQVMSNFITIGNIAEFIIYIGLLSWPIIAIGWVTTLIQQAAASQGRINEFLKEVPDVRFKDSDAKIINPEISWKEVDFIYPETGISAISNISFTIKAGQKLGIIGPAGSGKTTICQLITRMYDVTSGEIRIDNQNITELGKTALRHEIGYAPQDVFLFSDTIKENIAFGKADATQSEIEAAAKAAAVYDNIIDFSEGFDTVIGERGVNLSGGQKQRISIARAWITKPKILLLDDVLSAVDTQTEETILQNIRQFRAENPASVVIQIAHRLSCIQDADWILVLDEGKIVEEGTHENLLRLGGYYSRIYEKQLLEAVASN